MNTKKKCFSMFAKEAPCLDGEKTNIEAIVNIEVEIIGYRIKPSKYPGKNKSGQCLFLQMRIPGEDKTRIVFTGSDVLISQMKEYGHEVPFWATIRKVNRYYTLS